MAPRMLLLNLLVLVAATLSQLAATAAPTSGAITSEATAGSVPIPPPAASAAASPSPPARPTPANSSLADAESLKYNGEYEAAAERYRALIGAAEADLRRQAWLGLGETLLAAQRPDEAEEALQQVLASGAADAVRGRALVRLAGLRRDQGDCRIALGLLHEAEPLVSLGPYLALQRAACHTVLGEHEQAIAEGGSALRRATTAPARVDALERLALSSLDAGGHEDAAHWYAEIIPAARTESFRAQARLRLGYLELRLGRADRAVEQFRALVVAQPTLPAAGSALQALRDLGRENVISYAQAGEVLFNQGRFAEAQPALEAFLAAQPSGPEALQARFTAALARLRLGDERAAADALVALAQDHPEAPLAPVALLRAGRVLESLDAFQEAARVYERLASRYPGGPGGVEGRFRLGFVRWLDGDQASARSAWADLALDSAAPAASRAQAELWLGLAEDEAAAAQQHWQAAIVLDPHGYAGARAAARLGANAPDATPPAGPDLAAWSRQRGLDWSQARADVETRLAYQLASALWSAGLEPEASREFGALADDLAQHPVQLFALSATLAHPPTQHLSLTFAARAWRALGVPLAELPIDLQRLLYPLPYDPLARSSAQAFGVDPLLLAALARQESTFNAGARSPVGALGLTQVMPETGRLIAGELGVQDFQPRELLRPVVSLRFGAWYLSGRLDRYQSDTLPALAAYNAGDGAISAWLNTYCADPDCFAERIPYPETHRYVRAVFENYANYVRLYGNQSPAGGGR